jgi:hypothetical protein
MVDEKHTIESARLAEGRNRSRPESLLMSFDIMKERAQSLNLMMDLST